MQFACMDKNISITLHSLAGKHQHGTIVTVIRNIGKCLISLFDYYKLLTGQMVSRPL